MSGSGRTGAQKLAKKAQRAELARLAAVRKRLDDHAKLLTEAALQVIMFKKSPSDAADMINAQRLARTYDLCCCSICSRVYHGACLVPPISKSEWQDKVKEWICGECCKRDMLPLKAQLEVESATWD